MMARNRTAFLAAVLASLVFGGLQLPASPAGPASDAAGAVFSTSSASTAPLVYQNLAAPPQQRTAVHSAEADERIQRADQHLNAGKQLYFQGDLTGARREFDASIDALLNAPENLPDRRRIEAHLDRITDLVYRFDVEKLGAGETTDAVGFDQAPIDQISHMTFPVDQSLLPKVDFELKQTASAIPLELTDPVLSYIHYFSSDRGRKVLLAGFQRAGRYKPMIQRILAEEGVPQELIYLAEAESGFLPRAVSRAHAVGMWQFISGTGQLYDLERTSKIDERFDPPKATRAAARMLKDLYQRYGDWYLAMAAYNCGPLNVDRAVERTGYADYWELLKLRALPKETSNYVPIIVAMTIMAKNPNDYGLENIQEDAPMLYEDMKVNVATNVQLIADAAEQPVSVIRDLNPALLGNIAPAGTEVHMPLGAAQTTLAALESVPLSNRESWRLHHVVAGETLQAIAHEYNTPAGRIMAANQGADSLDAGDVLLIPAAYHPPARQVRSTRRSKSRSTSSRVASRRASSRSLRSHSVSPRALHRRAAVRTASLGR
jgi:membrane-bound lytic murein transglycosylase D